MSSSSHHEYMCPQCNHINALPDRALRNMYKEQLTTCEKCGCKLEVTPADGINNQINIVVAIAGQEYTVP
ncbi:hypothetical protein [Alteromonas ponticola]|uniref:CPXCG motif-containing cysteine-rich protein n=1 Tax=Alteromonas ponticola TaxID=2720613 RepID=A0ABX1R3D0_9ALTE|nr:hypothetical protein [Alteromonas ponticola]NMH60949.1 hypothetical protein [Alteromonas ponticola]